VPSETFLSSSIFIHIRKLGRRADFLRGGGDGYSAGLRKRKPGIWASPPGHPRCAGSLHERIDYRQPFVEDLSVLQVLAVQDVAACEQSRAHNQRIPC
jgi:hypothetical protein